MNTSRDPQPPIISRPPAKPGSSAPAMPPAPEPVDPAGPKEYTWPRGVFNFGNVVFGLSVLTIVVIVVFTLIAQ